MFHLRLAWRLRKIDADPRDGLEWLGVCKDSHSDGIWDCFCFCLRFGVGLSWGKVSWGKAAWGMVVWGMVMGISCAIDERSYSRHHAIGGMSPVSNPVTSVIRDRASTSRIEQEGARSGGTSVAPNRRLE